jgi:hypothetical protein
MTGAATAEMDGPADGPVAGAAGGAAVAPAGGPLSAGPAGVPVELEFNFSCSVCPDPEIVQKIVNPVYDRFVTVL